MRSRIALVLAALLWAAPAPALDLPFTVTKPGGVGPFPAVVLLHDCSGLGANSSGSPVRWAAELNNRGYVTIRADSFTTRGRPNGNCTGGEGQITIARRVLDAYETLAYLVTLPFVDKRRIAVMGGSHGGSTTLAVIVGNVNNAGRDGPRFAAAIALYPACGRNYGNWSVERSPDAPERVVGYKGVFRPLAPLLILIGGADDWTPAEPCERMASAAKDSGFPVDIAVFPGAHHSYDSPAPVRFIAERLNENARGGRGATTGGHAEAWKDSILRVDAFLKQTLAK